MNYKLVERDSKYDIFEMNTEQVVYTLDTLKDARALMRHLNLGGGFDGWSPTFFLKDVQYILNKH